MKMMRIFTRKQYEVVRALGEVLYPEGGAIPYSAHEVGVPEFMDDYVADLDKAKQGLIKKLLFLLEWGPILFLRKARRFTRLSLNERVDFLTWMEKSRFYFIRICLVSIRTLIGMGYMADARVLKSIGYFKNNPYPGDPRPIEIREVKHAG